MRVPRDLKEAIPRIRKAVDELSTELGREPEIAEVAEHTAMEEGEVLEAMEAATTSRPASLDAPIVADSEGDAAPMAEHVGDVDQNLEHTEWGVMLEERLEQLDDREREVLHLRFVQDLTQTEIGERIGVSQMQVSRILRAALERLRELD
jgi:RNA polymerase sigma-B factor